MLWKFELSIEQKDGLKEELYHYNTYYNLILIYIFHETDAEFWIVCLCLNGEL